jgi:hypothetical protein
MILGKTIINFNCTTMKYNINRVLIMTNLTSTQWRSVTYPGGPIAALATYQAAGREVVAHLV